MTEVYLLLDKGLQAGVIVQELGKEPSESEHPLVRAIVKNGGYVTLVQNGRGGSTAGDVLRLDTSTPIDQLPKIPGVRKTALTLSDLRR